MQTLRRWTRRLPSGAGLQVIAALLWTAQAALIAMAVQGMANGRGLGAAWPPAAGVLALGLLRAACEAVGSRLVFGQARSLLSDLRVQLARALAARSPLDLARPASGAAASLVAEQADALLPFLTRYQPAQWKMRLVPLAILACVLWFSWTAALVLALAAPLIPLFMAIVGWRAKAASEAQMLEQGGMNAFLLDRLRGLASLRALGAVDATATRLRETARALQERTMAVLRIAFLSSAVLELFSALGVAMVAVYVGFHLLGQLPFGTWHGQLDLGEGLFILLLAPAFFEPLRELSAVWHDRAAGEAALAAIRHSTQGAEPLPGAALATSPAAVAQGAPPGVVLHDVRLAHREAENVLDAMSMAIAPGEQVALFGPSGCGKSSLLALIAGLMPPRSGRIEIGGIRLDDGSAAQLRQRMAWMGQRPHVFAGTVHANVALADPQASRTRVQQALRDAGLQRVDQAHPAAAVGEGGLGLSGGEALRLALARLAVRADHADLLLVDEPTAHLDSETARHVSESLLALAQGRTLIVATHDPVLAARMDRVIHLGAAAQSLRKEAADALA
ncbi:thiol reductant ABC exporter subunit CydD [Variovorax sp. OV329]|uniref:thiol reductant ABC exporter subunit CydD n=1 Tax=Variovorax sp. OV329 TaxID=1882825 RepID=UPI000B860CD9|nr:thiol reductant ABC exporter subunit CydD [Variovorax sp. OV329]